MRTVIPTALLLVVVSTAAAAQASTSDSVPRAGQWAAEVGIGSGSGAVVGTGSGIGASLLRFQSPRRAWVFGMNFNVSRRESEAQGPFAGDETETFTFIGTRLGLRSYRESSTERLRPVVGGGLRLDGQWSSPTDTWQTGIYGELGAVYFVAPHLSLGATGELSLLYSKSEFSSGASSSETTAFGISGSLVRVLLAVYF